MEPFPLWRIFPMKYIVGAIGAFAVAVMASGCSVQTYGAHMMGHNVTEGASRADVLANLGEPDSIYRNNDVELLTYKGYRGVNILWVHSKIRRFDKVIVLSPEGTVQTSVDVDRGRGMTVISPPVYDATHPVSTKALTNTPDNYKVVME